jgi:hypothetical protein
MAAGNIEIVDGCVFHSDYAEVWVCQLEVAPL